MIIIHDINTKRTEEIVFCPTLDSHTVHIVTSNVKIRQRLTYEYLDLMTCWIYLQKNVFPHPPQVFWGELTDVSLVFFTSVIMSIWQYCNTTCYTCFSTALKPKPLRQMQIVSKRNHEWTFYNKHWSIVCDPDHDLNSQYEFLPAIGDTRVPQCNKVRLRHCLCAWILKLSMECKPRSNVRESTVFSDSNIELLYEQSEWIWI